jgi:AraC-like DNA-binding protein
MGDPFLDMCFLVWSGMVAPPFFRTIVAQPLGSITAGWKPSSPGVTEARDFPHHVLLITAAGTADFRDAAGRQAVLGPGDVLALFPGLPHTFAPSAGERWDEFYLFFSGPAFAPWYETGLLAPERPVLHVEQVAHWVRRFRAVADCADSDPPYAAVARLHALIADLLAEAGSGRGGGADRAWLKQACAMLGSDVRPPLAAVARRLGCSEQVFRKRFRSLAGVPPAAWRERRRLEAACDLLRAMSVSAVAERLGFCDPFHFSRRFSRRFGISPRGFRQAVLG